MSKNTPRSRFRIQMLVAAAICFALVGFAIFSQLQWGLDPCPLCIFQRLAFVGLGVVLLAAGVFAPRAPWGRRVWSLLVTVAAGSGIAISARHVWLQLFPPPIPACGPPLDFLRDTLSTGHLIRRVLTGTGDCGTMDWSFLGLSMPMWALAWFVLLGAWALYAGFSRSR